MMKAIILSIGLISTINASNRLLQQSCGANEEFTQCNGHCRPTCATGENIPCTKQCQPGCNCVDGYILDEDGGECVPIGQCSCKENEVFTFCNGHCRPTCETGLNIICTLQCQPGCNCAPNYILDKADGTCILATTCPAPEPAPECPLRCENGFDGCNNCFCDGLGNTAGCQKIGCPDGTVAPAGCTQCETGYTLNTVTNECESAKVSCADDSECDVGSGFKCVKDPECRAYSDVKCRKAPKVCVEVTTDVCSSDDDCDTKAGFACLDGDKRSGCVRYQ